MGPPTLTKEYISLFKWGSTPQLNHEQPGLWQTRYEHDHELFDSAVCIKDSWRRKDQECWTRCPASLSSDHETVIDSCHQTLRRCSRWCVEAEGRQGPSFPRPVITVISWNVSYPLKNTRWHPSLIKGRTYSLVNGKNIDEVKKQKFTASRGRDGRKQQVIAQYCSWMRLTSNLTHLLPAGGPSADELPWS